MIKAILISVAWVILFCLAFIGVATIVCISLMIKDEMRRNENKNKESSE